MDDFKIKTIVILTKYTGTEERVVVPEGVTLLRWSSFCENETIKELILPDSIAGIEQQACGGCKNLEYVHFPPKKVIMAPGSFNLCRNLKKVDLPNNNADNINLQWFDGGQLTEITTSPDNPYFYVSGPLLISKETGLIHGCLCSATEIIIPDGAKGFIKDPFYGDSMNPFRRSTKSPYGFHYKKMFISKTVSNEHFSGALLHTLLDAEEGVLEVDPENPYLLWEPPFLYTKDKTELIYCANTATGIVTVPDCLKKIGASAFHECRKITEIIIEGEDVIYDDSAFSFMSNLEHIKLSQKGTFEGAWHFEGDAQLKELNIPIGVTLIPYKICANCNNLLNVNISNTVTEIATKAFVGCRRLTHIEIPQSVNEVAPDAISGAKNIHMTVPEKLRGAKFLSKKNVEVTYLP